MKKFVVIPLTLYLLLVAVTKTADAAAACTEFDKEDTSEVNLFFKNVQCTLEKAKPWVEEIEKEAKKLEESAKKFGEGVISRLSVLMEKWIAGDNSTNNATIETDVKETVGLPVELNEVGNVSAGKCAEGQVPDVEGRCQQVV